MASSCGTAEAMSVLLYPAIHPSSTIRKQYRNARRTRKLHAENSNLEGSIPRLFQQKLKDAEEIWLQNNRLTGFIDPDRPCWERAQLIYFAENDLQSLPSAIASGWAMLEDFSISGNSRFENLPDEASRWANLRQLYLDRLPLLKSLPSCKSWSQLKVLHINNSGIGELPDDVDCLVNLTSVSLNDCNLTRLPKGIGKWTQVVKLFLNNNKLVELPEEIGEMHSLEKLYATQNQLGQIPESIKRLSALQELYLSKNASLKTIGTLPDSLNKLYVSDCEIEVLPDSLPKALEILHLSNNRTFRMLPASLSTTNSQLKFVHLANTGIQSLDSKLPEVLTQLRVFDVEGCELDEASAKIVGLLTAKLVKPWTFTVETTS